MADQITRRDFFAAHALTGILSGGVLPVTVTDQSIRSYAITAWTFADCMIEVGKIQPANQEDEAPSDIADGFMYEEGRLPIGP